MVFDRTPDGANIVRRKLITYGVCVNNSDPQAAGRIRAVPPEGENTAQTKCDDPKECIKLYDKLAAKGELVIGGGNAISYTPWMDDDPYTFSSFLPLQLNVIPQVGEAVKLISWETEKNLNQEYIGPMISQPGNLEIDAYHDGIKHTAAGVGNKTIIPYAVAIGDPKINPINIPLPESKGSFIHPDDVGIYGRNNTDIILGMAENSADNESSEEVEESYPQIVIRSGKLIKNPAASSRPTKNLKPTFIQLSTFPQTLTREEKDVPETTTEDIPVSTLIEYSMDRSGLCAQPTIFTGAVKVWKMPPVNSTNAGPGANGGGCMASLMANDQSVGTAAGDSGPTDKQLAMTITFTNAPSIEEIGREINALINNVDKEKWNNVIAPIDAPWATKTFSPNVDLGNQNNVGSFLGNTHPLYFAPNAPLLETMDKGEPSVWPGPATFTTVKAIIKPLQDMVGLDGVKTKKGGLAFEGPDGSREVKKSTKMVKTLVPGPPKLEQEGIITAAAEKIYLFSYNTTDLNGAITLTSNYGIPQAKFIDDIEKKTNSVVRGEKLIELLVKMANFQANHTHSCPGVASCPTAHDGTTTSDIQKLIEEAGETILNKNIRIN